MNKRIFVHHPDPWKNGCGLTFVYLPMWDGPLSDYLENGWTATYEDGSICEGYDGECLQRPKINLESIKYKIINMSEIKEVSAVEEVPALKCDDCKCCEEVEEQKYEVTFTLDKRYWNEELQRYLFSFHNDEVNVSTTPEVTIITTEYWRITDSLWRGGVIQLSIKRL